MSSLWSDMSLFEMSILESGLKKRQVVGVVVPIIVDFDTHKFNAFEF